MDKQPTFVQKLSLQEIALRRVVVVLWTGTDILYLFQKLPFKTVYDTTLKTEWVDTAERKVQDKVSKLTLPVLLMQQIMPIVRPIGSEILKWKVFHQNFLGICHQGLDVCFLKHLFWTSAGSIDYRKTALEFIRLEVLDNVKLYKLACLYCLEDCIPVIWKALPGESKVCFYKQDAPLLEREPQMEFCWAYVLREKDEAELDCAPESRFANPTSFCRRAFKSLAIEGNKAAAEYFFQKLTHEERETLLVETTHRVLRLLSTAPGNSRCDFPREKHTDIVCYLLFLMTPEQQKEIFQDRPFEVLRCFLDWPWQDFFSDMADLFWTFNSESRYEDLVDVLTTRVNHESRYFTPFFRKFFMSSPSAFRKCFVEQECQSQCLLDKLFFCENAEALIVMFRNIDVEDRVKFVACNIFFAKFGCMLNPPDEHWNMIELCLREAIAGSVENREKVRKVYMDFFNSNFGRHRLRDVHWKRIWELTDQASSSESVGSSSMGSSDDETVTKSKKLRKRRKKNILPHEVERKLARTESPK